MRKEELGLIPENASLEGCVILRISHRKKNVRRRPTIVTFPQVTYNSGNSIMNSSVNTELLRQPDALVTIYLPAKILNAATLHRLFLKVFQNSLTRSSFRRVRYGGSWVGSIAQLKIFVHRLENSLFNMLTSTELLSQTPDAFFNRFSARKTGHLC